MLGATYQPTFQNLAWLGEDGQVHTVNQNSNGGPKMLGATYQPTFQNLAWLGEDGQVHKNNEHAMYYPQEDYNNFIF